MLKITGLLLLLLFVLTAGVLLTHRQQPVAVVGTGCVDIPASPDYMSTSSEADAIAAINNAHAQEKLPPLRLPTNFYRLAPPQQQFILLNIERTDRGLPSLEMDATLSQMALGYSRQLSDLHFFSHTSPISGTFSNRMEDNPATANQYSLAAENLAGNPVAGVGPIYEYMYDDSAEGCGHRLNMLDPQLTLIGINWVHDKQYGSISAQEFLATSDWNFAIHASPDTLAPFVTAGKPLLKGSLLSCQVLTRDNIGVVRITWFLDRVGNQPLSGPALKLDVRHLSPGRHTLLVYVVDGALNYSQAICVITLK